MKISGCVRPAARLLVLALALLAAPSCRRCERQPIPTPVTPSVLTGQAAPESMARLAARLPADPLVFLYTEDLAGLAKAVRESGPTKTYLDSKSYQGFTESRLYYKLEGRFQELVGLCKDDARPIDLLDLAGSESALALYDIGEIGFVYLSRIDHERFSQSLLGAAMPKAAEESLGGAVYYVLGEAGGKRLFFALSGDLLVASNQEDRFRQALERAAADEALPGSMAEGESFAQAFPPGFKAHDLVMFLDQEALNQDPYFKRYWIMQNVGELDWVRAVVVDLDLAGGRFQERRFYSSLGQSPPFTNRDLAWSARLEADAMFGEGMSLTSAKRAADLLASLLPPQAAPELDALAALIAPAAPTTAGQTARINWDDSAVFFNLERSVVIHFDEPDGLDLDRLREHMALALGRAALIGPGLRLEWESDDHGQVLKLPLLGGPGLWMDRRGSSLVVSNDGALHGEVLAMVESNRPAPRLGLYNSRWDLGRARDDLGRAGRKLAEYRDWPGYESRTVMERDLMNLLAVLGGGSFERRLEIADQMLVETIIFKPGP